MKVIAVLTVLCLAQSVIGCRRAQRLDFGKFKQIGLLTRSYTYIGDMVEDWFQTRFDKETTFGMYKVYWATDQGKYQHVHYPMFVLRPNPSTRYYKAYYFEYIEVTDKRTETMTRKLAPLTAEEFTTKYNHCDKW
ncbi:hypothetical protein TELCIR_13758 [Teladorsagia circumcincta]|uniref:Uncharacterized protein n=1 Tax=Teladorsagia circumcincta TaxID=45464 RepID=A0A2G9U2W7_TELCI|nr:hypothetical protein TELCIR_13758 [Teladorsagia circumcincta]